MPLRTDLRAIRLLDQRPRPCSALRAPLQGCDVALFGAGGVGSSPSEKGPFAASVGPSEAGVAVAGSGFSVSAEHELKCA